MDYIFNGTNLNTFSFTAVKQSGSDIALSGHLDLPERVGKCFHSWNGQNDVEPYTSANEIVLGHRNISLRGVISGNDRLDCLDKLQSLYNFINGITTVAPLVTPYGSYSARIIEAIEGKRLSDNLLEVVISFNEPSPTISGTIPNPDGDNGIDGISFEALGGFLISADDRYNRAATKQLEVKNYIGKTSENKLTLELMIVQPTYANLEAKVKGLQMLMVKSGERNLLIKEGLQRRVFACNGFSVTGIRNNNQWYVNVTIELIQSQQPQPVIYLADNIGNEITDNLNNKILLKWQ